MAFLLAGSLVAGCSGNVTDAGNPASPKEKYKLSSTSAFGKDLYIYGGPEEKNESVTGIAVNSFLWRASLDTISFMPLASADPFGGVIITEWFSPPETQAERFKVTIYILGRDLRADGVRAAVFRQSRDGANAWIDARVDERTAVELENAILTRARQLRIAGLQ